MREREFKLCEHHHTMKYWCYTHHLHPLFHLTDILVRTHSQSYVKLTPLYPTHVWWQSLLHMPLADQRGNPMMSSYNDNKN